MREMATAQSAESATDRYDAVAQALHWGMALLIVGNFGLAWYMEGLPPTPAKIDLYNWHKSIGLVALVLAAVRLLWRRTHPAPPLPATMPRWERAAATASHHLLYLLLFLQPLSGLFIAFASEFPTTLFGAFNLPSPIGENAAVKDAAGAVHWYGQWALVALVGLHAAAALRHHFLLKDDTLKRMIPGGKARFSLCSKYAPRGSRGRFRPRFWL